MNQRTTDKGPAPVDANRDESVSGWLVALLLFSLVLAGLFWPLITGSGTVVHADAASVSLPLQQTLTSALASGTFPLWSDQIYGGHPLFAEGQGAFAHPLNLLLFGVASLGSGDPGPATAPSFATVYAHGLFHVCCLLLAALGTFGLCRTLGLGLASSLLAGLALACSQDWLVLTGNSAIAGSVAWAPAVLLTLERWWRRPVVGRAIAVAVASSGMVLAGYPQAVHGITIFALLSFAVRIDRAWLADPWRHVGTGALALLLAAGLSAVQLLPTLELVGASVRAEGVGLVASATPDLMLRGMLFSIGKRAAVDPGLGSVVLLALALFGARLSRPVLAYLLPTLVLFQLSLAEHSALYRAVHHLLPGLDSFRITHLYTTLALIGVAVLAGYGVERVERLERVASSGRPTRGLLVWAAGVVALVSAGCLWVFDDLVPAWSWVFPVVAVAAVSVLLVLRAPHRVPAALLGLVLVEIAVLRAPLHDFAAAFVLREPPPTVRYLQALPPEEQGFRIANVPHFFSYVGFASPSTPGLGQLVRLYLSSIDAGSNLLWALPSVNANLALPLARRVAVEDLITRDVRGESVRVPGRRFIDSMSVRWLVAHRKHRAGPYSAELEQVFVDDELGFFVLKNAESRPRLQLYGEGDVGWVAGVEAAVAELQRDGALLVIEGEEPRGRASREVDPGVIRSADVSANRYEVELELSAPGYLFVADAPYVGWQARVDGGEVPVLAANVLGKAVRVPPGQHRVSLSFEPMSFRVGAGISLATLGVVVWLAALAAWRAR